MTHRLLAAAMLALAGLAPAQPEPKSSESLVRWEWQVRWLQDVPELNVVMWNETERPVWARLVPVSGAGTCPAVRGALEFSLPARGWSHRSAPLVRLRGDLPCELAVRVVAGFESDGSPATIRATRTSLFLPARSDAPRTVPMTPADIELSSRVEDTCDAGRVEVRVLVRSRAAAPTRARPVLAEDRCSDGTALVWDQFDGTALDLPAHGWAVFVASVRAPKTSLFRSCTASIEILGVVDGSEAPVGRIGFPLVPESTATCVGDLR